MKKEHSPPFRLVSPLQATASWRALVNEKGTIGPLRLNLDNPRGDHLVIENGTTPQSSRLLAAGQDMPSRLSTARPCELSSTRPREWGSCHRRQRHRLHDGGAQAHRDQHLRAVGVMAARQQSGLRIVAGLVRLDRSQAQHRQALGRCLAPAHQGEVVGTDITPPC